MTTAREREDRWTGHTGRGPTRHFEGSTPSRGSRVSISHQYCLASFLERSHPLRTPLTRARCRKRRRREAYHLAEALSSRHRKRDSLKHETLLAVERCRAVCKDGNARSETRFPELHVQLVSSYLSYQIKIGTRSI